MELVLTRSILPLGLYRTREANDSPLPYVIANPPPSLILHKHDRLFVLCGDGVIT